MTIAKKLTTYILVLAIIPIVIACFVVYSSARDALQQRAISTLIAVADIQEKRVNEVLRYFLQDVKLVTSRTQLRTSLEDYTASGDKRALERMQTIIADAKHADSVIDSIAIYDLKGRIIASTQVERIGETHADEQYFSDGKQREQLHDIVKNDQNILLVRMVGPFVREEKVIGVVEMLMNASPFIAITEDYAGLGDTGEAVLAKRNAVGDALVLTPLRFQKEAALKLSIAHDDPHRPLARAISGKEEILSGKDATDYRGEHILAVTRFIDALNWGLVVKIDREEALAPSAWLLRVFFVVVGVTVLLILIFALLLARSISLPLQTLISIVGKMKEGDLSQRVRNVSQDEIGLLGTTFNSMVESLEKSHLTLEDTVKERTKEISTILGALDNVALVSMTDKKGDIIYTNDKFVEVSKYSREELIGQNHRILKSGHQSQSLFIGLWNTISHGKVWRGEIKNRAKDGTYYWVDTAIAPLLNAAGRPERYISVRFLITEKKRAMLDIRKFQQAVTASTDGIIITDPQTRIIYVNPAWSRLTGYSMSEVLGKKASVLKTEKTDEKVFLAIREAVRNGQPFHSDEFVNRRKDGTEYNAELTMFPVRKEEGEEEVTDPETILFFVGIHADVTGRKQSERAKTEFVSLASHQLRTPLTEIRWALSSLGREELTGEQKETIETAHSAASHMAETIKAMLTISHIEAGEMYPEPTLMNLCSAIDDVVRLYDGERRQKKITLSVQCEKSMALNTDEQLFKEVISNLLANAYRYTPKSGKVDVIVYAQQDRLIIDISDTGCGIPIREQKHIAQKFFRASNAVTIHQEGSGLGLYMTYALVQLLGGTISFSSKEQKGTTFSLSFPHSL